MKRYHVKVYTPNNSDKKLKLFTDKINALTWRYSAHALDNIKYRVIDNKALLLHIKGLTLSTSDVFEYYTSDTGGVIKACYRIAYTKGIDIILVVGYDKQLITIYINTSDDKHATLKPELYVRN